VIPQPSSEFLILAGELTEDAIGNRIGNLALGLTAEAATASFVLLDSFDQSLHKEQQMLIETDGELALYHDSGPVTQDARRNGQLVADLAPGPVKDALQRLSPLRSLLSIGTGTASRRQLSLTDDEGKTRARVELVMLRPQGNGTPVTLTSLQGLRGYDNAMRALREHIATVAGPGLDDVSGITAVLFPANIPYVAKPVLRADPNDTAFRAAGEIISAYLDVARRNEAGIIADHDTEFLHDYRVALRKIRSVVSLFKGVYSDEQTEALKVAFSDLMAPTGRLRDLDVYLLGCNDYYAMLPETLHEGLTLMFQMFAEERQREQKQIAKWFQSARYRDSITALEALFAAPETLATGPEADHQAYSYACALIWKRYRKVCKIAATIMADTPDEQVHELRISCKKLRYLMEFFAPVLPGRELKLLLKPLKDLQDNLGLFNDYSVQQVALQNVMNHHPSKGRKQDLMLAQSIGALIAVLHGRQKEEREKVTSTFARFDSPETRWMFRDLFYGKGD
jgi:CHAD domain-containing protein